MTKAELYLNAARKFGPAEPAARGLLARELRKWVEEQAREVRELGPIERLRCWVNVTLPRS